MNLSIILGNDKAIELTITDADDNIVDLTDGLLEFHVTDWRGTEKILKTSADAAEIEITDAVAGEATLKFVPADTATLTAGMYVFYLDFTTAQNKIYTIYQGDFQIQDKGVSLYIRNRIRNYNGDKEDLNVLIRAQECTDVELNDYIAKAIDSFNGFGYLTEYTISDYPNMGNLIDGVILQILQGRGILSARNMLTYQDSGGITVQDFDTYGRYINLFNTFVNKYVMQVTDIKRSLNVDGAYGSIESPMSELY